MNQMEPYFDYLINSINYSILLKIIKRLLFVLKPLLEAHLYLLNYQINYL